MKGLIRVVLADDHPLFRDGLRQILQFDEDILVVGEAGNGEAAVNAVGITRPDVALLDVEMPGQGVANTLVGIRRASPTTQVIVLTMCDDADLVNELLQLGASGYLLKSVTRLDLVAAIRRVAGDAGQVVLSVSRDSLTRKTASAADTLSGREREVLELAAKAMSNAQIATRLGISEATVKRHLYNVFGKLGAVSRIDAANKYYKRT